MDSTTPNPTFTFPDGTTINRLGFGAMRLTGPGIWGEPKDPQEAKEVLKRAIALGINFIDTADSYGPEVSERLIGETLHPYPDGLIIATKGGLTRGGPDDWRRNGQPEHLRQAIEGSLKRLRLDTIDLYQLHSPDSKVPYEDSVGTLADLQQEGKIRHIGVSNVSVEEIKQAQSLVTVVTVQNQYNLAHRDSEDVLNYCEAQGIGFIPWYPLDTGKLTTQDRLSREAKAYQVSPHQLALAWLLHRSPVMLPIPGTSKVAHLEENMAATRLTLTEETMEALDEL